MKKWMLFVGVLTLLAALLACAQAEITVMGPGTLEYDKALTWKATNTEGSGGTYKFYILDRKTYKMLAMQESTSQSFTYSFISPGSYFLVVNCIRNGKMTSKSVPLTLPEDGVHLTLAQRAAQLVAQAKSKGCTTQYDIALYLHDWITDNACYDQKDFYYGAIDVLSRGTGVCNAYAEAYTALLNAAGIENYELSGDGHGWNVAKLDGVWCHIDTTWDDPLNSSKPTAAKSGREGHYYFGLDDATMLEDHTFSPRGVNRDAFKNNYFIRTGFVDKWLGSESSSSSILGKVKAYVNRKAESFSFTVPETYLSPLGYTASGNKQIVYAICAYALSVKEFKVGNDIYMCDVYYVNSENRLYGTVYKKLNNQMVLPSYLKEIEEEAFAGSSAEWITLPEGALSIGDMAFSGCASLQRVDIPASVTEFGSNIFRNSPNVVIYCEAGSAAESYAKSNSIKYVQTK